MKKKQSQDVQFRQLISNASVAYEFEEVFTIKESTNDSEEIKIKTIKKGVFKDKEGYSGSFCKFIDPKTLQPPVHRAFLNKEKVKKCI